MGLDAVAIKNLLYKWTRVEGRTHYPPSFEPCATGAQGFLGYQKRIGAVTILRKGKSDFISDGKTACAVSIYGSPRRCGGQGDILSGSVAVFLSWARQCAAKGEVSMNPTILGCVAGSALLRKAAALAFESKKRSTLTGDIIECLGRSLQEICPV